jgi:hypothetical protein
MQGYPPPLCNSSNYYFTCVLRKREDHLSFQHRHFGNIQTWYNDTMHKRDWDENVQNAGIPPSVTLQIIVFLD